MNILIGIKITLRINRARTAQFHLDMTLLCFKLKIMRAQGMQRMAKAHEMIDQRRRAFVQSAAIGLFVFQVAGCDKILSPKGAREAGADFRVLSASQVVTLEALGEWLAPGAAAAGLAHYIDANLARAHGQSLLMVRYLDILQPQAAFYQQGLDALEAHSRRTEDKAFSALSEDAANTMIAALFKGNPEGWEGPPAPLFYFAVRADAADIVYGTMAGFEKLNVPYVGHINPTSDY